MRRLCCVCVACHDNDRQSPGPFFIHFACKSVDRSAILPRQCILARCAEFMERFQSCTADDIRFFSTEKAAQQKATSRLLDDLRDRTDEKGHDAEHLKQVELCAKKVHFVNEIVRVINKSGLASSACGTTYDSLCHFLSVEPVVSDLIIPAFITQARFHSKAQEVAASMFWNFISTTSIESHKFEQQSIASTQREAVVQRFLNAVRENDDDLVTRLHELTDEEASQGAHVTPGLVDGIDAVRRLVRPQSSTIDMLEKALSCVVEETTCANCLTTYPGGRKVISEAEAILGDKRASEKALAKFESVMEPFRQQVDLEISDASKYFQSLSEHWEKVMREIGDGKAKEDQLNQVHALLAEQLRKISDKTIAVGNGHLLNYTSQAGGR